MIERSGKTMLFLYAVFVALLGSGIIQIVFTGRGVPAHTAMSIGIATMIVGFGIIAFTRWHMSGLILGLIGLAADYAGIRMSNSPHIFDAWWAGFLATCVFSVLIYVAMKRFASSLNSSRSTAAG